MCRRNSLVICGDSIPISDDTNTTIDDLVNYSYDFFAINIDYIYITDEKKYGVSEYFNYMNREADGIMYGDCEDFAITYLENNIRDGNIQKGDEEYIFDNIHPTGVELNKEYSKGYYKELFTIYSY